MDGFPWEAYTPYQQRAIFRRLPPAGEGGLILGQDNEAFYLDWSRAFPLNPSPLHAAGAAEATAAHTGGAAGATATAPARSQGTARTCRRRSCGKTYVGSKRQACPYCHLKNHS